MSSHGDEASCTGLHGDESGSGSEGDAPGPGSFADGGPESSIRGDGAKLLRELGEKLN